METRRSSPIRPNVSRSGPAAGGSVSGAAQAEASSIGVQITRTRGIGAGVHNGPVDQSFRAAVVTVSDGVTAGTRQDQSGDVAEEILRAAGYEVDSRSVVPDDRPAIESSLRDLATQGIHLVATTGGTGF